MKVYNAIYQGHARTGRPPGQGLPEGNEQQLALEEQVARIFAETGTADWTWQVGRQ